MDDETYEKFSALTAEIKKLAEATLKLTEWTKELADRIETLELRGEER